MNADGPEQREADRLERIARAEHRLEEREQNSDEGRDDLMRDLIEDYAEKIPERSPLADMIFDVAKANMLASQVAFNSGYTAARRDEIYLVDGIKALLGLIQLVCSRDDMPRDIKYALETNHRIEEAKDALARVGQ
jgi:hypothetical protein